MAPGQGQREDVPERRQVQQHAAPRQLPLGRRAWHRGGAAHGLEGKRQAPVEAAASSPRSGSPATGSRSPKARAGRSDASAGDEEHPASRGAVLEERRALRGRRSAAAARSGTRRCGASPTQGPEGFYKGKTAALIEQEMAAHGGLITPEDLEGYRAKKRNHCAGTLPRDTRSSPCPRSAPAATALIEMLNILEGYDLPASGFRVRRHRAPDDRGHAPGLRRSGTIPGRSRIQSRRCRSSG